MKRVLIASHGRIASGFKSAIEILKVNVGEVTAVDCYVDDSDYTPKLQAFIDSVGPDDDAIIFTDLIGGSVCNKVMTLKPETKGIQHVAGANLITILECLLTGEKLTAEKVDEIVAGGSSQMRRVSVEQVADDGAAADDDFFG